MSSPRSIRSSLAAPDELAGATRWIGSMIRVSSSHPAMTHVLDVIERLQNRPYRTNALILGEPGTGKDGLGRALHQLMAPGAPLVRLDVVGFSEDAGLEALCGKGRRAGAAERAAGGTLMIEEIVGLPARVQEALLRLLKAGRIARVGDAADRPQRLQVQVIALSDHDVAVAVAAGRLRHDLYHRLARIVLWLPPLRQRKEDVGPTAIWMGNRILKRANLPLDLRATDDLRTAPPQERRRAIEISRDAVDALERHAWPGNFRELEGVLERALLLYRAGQRLDAEAIAAALAPIGP